MVKKTLIQLICAILFLMCLIAGTWYITINQKKLTQYNEQAFLQTVVAKPGIDKILDEPYVLSIYPDLDMAIKVRPESGGSIVQIESLSKSKLIAENAVDWIPVNCTWIDKNRIVLIRFFEGRYLPMLWRLGDNTFTPLNQLRTIASWLPPVYIPESNSLISYITEGVTGELVEYNFDSKKTKSISKLFSARSDIAISPNGMIAAGASKSGNNILQLTENLSGSQMPRAVEMPGRIREISFAPNNRFLSITAREKDDEHNKLFILDVESGKIIHELMPDSGDIYSPRWIDSSSIAYQIVVHGEGSVTIAQLDPMSTRSLKQIPGTSKPVRSFGDGKQLLIHHSPLDHESGFLQYAISANIIKPVINYNISQSNGIAPESLITKNPKNHEPVYSWLWNSARPSDSAVVYIHGGPSLYISPAFDRKIQSLLSRGFPVVAVNYSGSTGYGRSYARFRSIADQVNDIRSVCEFLHGTKHIQHILLLAESYGSEIAINLLNEKSNLFKGVVLVSPSLRDDPALEYTAPGIAVIGEWDSIDKENTVRILKNRIPLFERKNWSIVNISDEGHNITSVNGQKCILNAIDLLASQSTND